MPTTMLDLCYSKAGHHISSNQQHTKEMLDLGPSQNLLHQNLCGGGEGQDFCFH